MGSEVFSLLPGKYIPVPTPILRLVDLHDANYLFVELFE
jgi:hypothetical protein